MNLVDRSFFLLWNSNSLHLQIQGYPLKILTVAQKSQMSLRTVEDPVARTGPEFHAVMKFSVQIMPFQIPAVRNFHSAAGIIPAIPQHIFQIIVNCRYVPSGTFAEQKKIIADGFDPGILITHVRPGFFAEHFQRGIGKPQKDPF